MVTTLQLAASLATGTPWNLLIIDNLQKFLYDAALSTSAAPVYFPPYHHPAFGWCSAGGLFANNPAPQAVALAIETGIAISDISLLSIGTGFTNSSLLSPIQAAYAVASKLGSGSSKRGHAAFSPAQRNDGWGFGNQ